MRNRRLQWCFRNRETGAVTIAQAPNLILWIVILASILLWLSPLSGRQAVALGIIVKAGLVVWAVDEVFRGVNPWRRCLGAAVLCYELATVL
jgi:FtsH-binding integral membrane protein